MEGRGRVYVSAGRMSARVFYWERGGAGGDTHNCDSPPGSMPNQQPTSRAGLQTQGAVSPHLLPPIPALLHPYSNQALPPP